MLFLYVLYLAESLPAVTWLTVHRWPQYLSQGDPLMPSHSIRKLEARGCIQGTSRSIVFYHNLKFFVIRFVDFLRIAIGGNYGQKNEKDVWTRKKTHVSSISETGVWL